MRIFSADTEGVAFHLQKNKRVAAEGLRTFLLKPLKFYYNTNHPGINYEDFAPPKAANFSVVYSFNFFAF